MATKKKGMLTKATFNAMCKHLRPYGKRAFWHRERRTAKRLARTDVEAYWVMQR